MWDEGKRAWFQALRQREDEGTLTESERAELVALIQEIESSEEAYLRPATERLRAERLQTETQNAALRNLVQRQEKLVQRLREVLAEADAERHAIAEEVARVLSGSSPSSGTPQ